MELFEVVPMSWWTLAVLVLGLALAVMVWRPVLTRTGWRAGPTLVAAACLITVSALTLAPAVGRHAQQAPGCVLPGEFGVAHLFADVARDLETALNVALLAPLGLALVLASRRALPPLVVVLALPGLIELAQVAIPGRVCSTADYVLNTPGGLVGVAAGAAVVHRPGARGRRGRRLVP